MPIKTQAENVLAYAKDQFLQLAVIQSRPVQLAWRALLGMRQDDATHLAAGIAYYAIFSTFPLLLGLLAIMGMVLNSPTLQQQFLAFVSDNIPGSAEFVSNNVRQIVRLRGALGIGAIIILLWLGRAVFAAITRAINRAWGIRKDQPFYIAIPQQLAMTIILGTLLLLSTVATSIIQLLNIGIFGPSKQEPLLDLGLSYIALYVIPSLITLLVFLLIYRFVPNRKMRWSYVWPGAIVAAALFEGAKILFLWYLQTFAVYNQLYGSLASVMVFLFWAFLSAMILILGAEICYEYERLYYPSNRQTAADGSERPLA